MVIVDYEVRRIPVLFGILVLGISLVFFFFLTFNSIDITSVIIFIVALGFAFFSCYLFSLKSGIEFDFEESRYCRFRKSILENQQNWVSLESWDSIVILKKRGAKWIGDTELESPQIGLELKINLNEVYLMNADHSCREYIINYNSEKKALGLARAIEEKTHLKIRPYSPPKRSRKSRYR